MTQRLCETCRWWNRHSGLATGDCQRHPPEHNGEWARTDEVDFCGEWADKNITPQQHERRELVRQFAVALVASGSEAMVHQVWQWAAELADYEGQT